MSHYIEAKSDLYLTLSEVDALHHISQLLAKNEVDAIAAVVAAINTLVVLLDSRVGPDHGDPEVQ